jgi:hypothetical protein
LNTFTLKVEVVGSTGDPEKFKNLTVTVFEAETKALNIVLVVAIPGPNATGSNTDAPVTVMVRSEEVPVAVDGKSKDAEPVNLSIDSSKVLLTVLYETNESFEVVIFNIGNSTRLVPNTILEPSIEIIESLNNPIPLSL